MVATCDSKSSDEMVHIKTNLFCVHRPSSCTVSGLLECVARALSDLSITEVSMSECKNLVGFGTNGAAVNISKLGLKGLIEKELQWIFWMWYLADRLELSVKDSLTCTVFDCVDDMLMKLYYIYEKFPKNAMNLRI